MAQKRNAIEQLIKRATESKMRQFDRIRGKQTITFPYWDIVIVTAADSGQKMAYDLQLKQKLAREQLPLGVIYHVLKDPGDNKIGPGGSMMAALSWLYTIYNEALFRKKVLFIPAGGLSQRLPSASLLGKIFTAVPCGRPICEMLELLLAMYIDLPAHMDSGGVFLACADTIILYDSTVGVEWSFSKPGITAFGHPAPLNIGTTHGVFLLPEDKEYSHVHIVECKEFLHKRSAQVLKEKGTLLRPSCQEALGITEDYVLVDSSYYMDSETMKKLIEFYEEKSPLSCEIDSHGDFLHGLGSHGNTEYIHDYSNVHSKTGDLPKMRQEVCALLRGTPLHVLVLPHSKFYHIGTTQELLHHYCCNSTLASELGFKKCAFSRSVDKCDFPDSSQVNRKACIMNSIVPRDLDTSRHFIVEYCHIKSPCIISEGCIVSNCTIQTSPDSTPTIPPNTFLHTAAIRTPGKGSLFVTFFFDIHDDLKKSVIKDRAANLSFLNKSLQEVFRSDTDSALQTMFPASASCSMWNAKIFPAKQTMEESFQSAMTQLSDWYGQSETVSPCIDDSCLSIGDLMKLKDIEVMLEYRKQLYSFIIQECAE